MNRLLNTIVCALGLTLVAGLATAPPASADPINLKSAYRLAVVETKHQCDRLQYLYENGPAGLPVKIQAWTCRNPVVKLCTPAFHRTVGFCLGYFRLDPTIVGSRVYGAKRLYAEGSMYFQTIRGATKRLRKFNWRLKRADLG